MTAELAARIITIEEEDAPWTSGLSAKSNPTAAVAGRDHHYLLIDNSILPSEQNRICSFGILKNLTLGRMEVSVLRRREAADGTISARLVRDDYAI